MGHTKFLVMGDNQARPDVLGQPTFEPPSAGRVQAGKRFIENQHGGVAQQRHCEGDSFANAGAEAGARGVNGIDASVGQSRQCIAGSKSTLECEVLQGRPIAVEGNFANIPDILPRFCAIFRIDSLHHNFTFAGGGDAGGEAQQGAFSATVGAVDGNDFIPDFEFNAAQNLVPPVTAMQVLNGNHAPSR